MTKTYNEKGEVLPWEEKISVVCYTKDCEKEAVFEVCWCSEEHKNQWQREEYGGDTPLKVSNEIQSIVEKLRSKELKLPQIMSRDLFFLTKFYWLTNNKQAMALCVKEANSRMDKRGLKYVQGLGWVAK